MCLRITNPSPVFFFFFNDTAPTEIYTLSLHAALPISLRDAAQLENGRCRGSLAHDAARRSMAKSDAILRSGGEGGPEDPPSTAFVCAAYGLAGGLILPAMICARSLLSVFRYDAGTFEFTLPSATPLFFRLNTRFLPPANWPLSAPLIARYTP